MKLPYSETPSTANVLTADLCPRLAQPIILHDNTLREGEQPPGVVFDTEVKVALAEAIADLGVPWLSVGFPAVSEDERAAAVRIVKAGLGVATTALARMLEADISATLDCGVDCVSLFFGLSDGHLRHKYGCNEEEAFARIESSIRFVRDRGGRALFTAEDASRTPLPRLRRALRLASDAGAEFVKLADTVGVLTPSSCGRLVARLREELPSARLGVHFHNDLGLALANTLAALEAGAEMVDVTVNGLGERAGNTCLEELAVLLKLKYARDLGLKLDRLGALSEQAYRLSGTAQPHQKPVVGRWSSTHEAGIHVAGVLANRETYQAYPPEWVGRQHEIVFGKHSGIQSVSFLASHAGLALSDAAKREVLARIKQRAELERHAVDEELVLSWMRELL